MEEDNASDINKFIGTEDSGDRAEVTVTVKEKTFRAKIILRGNVLSVMAIEEAHVPLIFVIEKVSFKKATERPSVSLQFACEEDSISIQFDNEVMMEDWMIKLATCSHAISHAQLDEVAYKFFTMGTATEEMTPDTTNPSSFHNFYLANPITQTHIFAVSQANGLPARRITFEETMWESKLSLLLPMELIKLYRKWNTEFLCLLESKLHSWPAQSMSTLQEIIRELREIAETYEQCQEFLSTYSGPQFRKSTEKRRVAFGAVPTNLHLQVFGVAGEHTREILTCGTASSAPNGFANGGLSRLQTALDVNNALWTIPFFSKRNVLLDLKRSIGELSRKMEVEWKMSSFGKPDTVCLEINTGIKQVYEKLKDTFARIPNIDSNISNLLEEHQKRFTINELKRKNSIIIVGDSLQNQLDNLDAMIISLNTKIAVIDALDDEQRGVYEKSAREAMSSSLDALLMLTDTVLEAQLYGLVTSLSKPATIHHYFHIQVRSDFVFSQAVTIAATAALSRIQNWPTNGDNDFLFVIFSFLSAYADEKGMIEDACEAWRLVESKAEFKFVRAPSSVCRNCIPVVSGTRAGVKISLPLPHEKFDFLPDSLKTVDSFRIRTAYFNLGVNHEATFAQSFGGVAFETAINQEAAQKIAGFSARLSCTKESVDAVVELSKAVSTEGSRKNLDIFEWAMRSCELMGGRAAVSCKSGKDRTSMAVTLEQGRLVRETCGLGTIQVAEVITSLRKDGVRRENCRKNVGKPLYSFSPFQMHFLPKPFRPPMGTYRQGVAS